MENYLITGASGFVSAHFLNYLETNAVQANVMGLDLNEPEFSTDGFRNVKFEFQRVDLLNVSQVNEVLEKFRPDYVLHLASYSSVAFSWQNPIVSFTNNTNIFLNILEQLRLKEIRCRIVSVGSSEEYGNFAASDLPLKESHHLNPLSPYAVARVAQELLSNVYNRGYKTDIVLTRSFNHIGPGQRPVFVVASFAKKLNDIKKGRIHSAEFSTGDLSIVRDFVDVRDVVRAYYLLLKKGESGEVYNICSGKGISLAELLRRMAEIAGVEINPVLNPFLTRPDDNRIIIGSNEKIKRAVNWTNEIDIETSFRDIIAYFGNLTD